MERIGDYTKVPEDPAEFSRELVRTAQAVEAIYYRWYMDAGESDRDIIFADFQAYTRENFNRWLGENARSIGIRKTFPAIKTINNIADWVTYWSIGIALGELQTADRTQLLEKRLEDCSAERFRVDTPKDFENAHFVNEVPELPDKMYEVPDTEQAKLIEHLKSTGNSAMSNSQHLLYQAGGKLLELTSEPVKPIYVDTRSEIKDIIGEGTILNPEQKKAIHDAASEKWFEEAGDYEAYLREFGEEPDYFLTAPYQEIIERFIADLVKPDLERYQKKEFLIELMIMRAALDGHHNELRLMYNIIHTANYEVGSPAYSRKSSNLMELAAGAAHKDTDEKSVEALIRFVDPDVNKAIWFKDYPEKPAESSIEVVASVLEKKPQKKTKSKESTEMPLVKKIIKDKSLTARKKQLKKRKKRKGK